jgi:hypothetical protein
MADHTSSLYFFKRERQSWLSLAFVGIAAPLLSSLHTPNSIITLTAAAFGLPAIWNIVQSHRERNGELPPASAKISTKFGERRQFGVSPLGDLFERSRDGRPFEDLVTEAAYCSNEYGRRLCVICVHVPELPPLKRHVVAQLLRKHVRANDQVEIAPDDQFLVCAPLLRDALSADVIVNRLEGALRNSDLLGDTLAVRLGKAVYPLDGYTGPALISSSRENLRQVAMGGNENGGVSPSV